ncbi:unnamed protein product [Boreogadus saida]
MSSRETDLSLENASSYSKRPASFLRRTLDCLQQHRILSFSAREHSSENQIFLLRTPPLFRCNRLFSDENAPYCLQRNPLFLEKTDSSCLQENPPIVSL